MKPVHAAPLRRALLVGGAAAAAALPVRAQPAPSPRAAPPTWTLAVGGGVLAEPYGGGRTGPAVVADVGRRLSGSRVRIAGVVAAARISDVNAPKPDRFVIDRDWRLAAAGPEVTAVATGRLGVTLGAQAGALWNRNRRVGAVGTPVPPGFPDLGAGPGGWTASVALIPSARASYRVGGPVAVSGGVAGLLRLFTDNLVGSPGALVSLGVSLGW